MKATYAVVNGEGHELSKDPKTDSGTKKSAKGLLRVEKDGNNFVLFDQQTWQQEDGGCLKTVFLDGMQLNMEGWTQIRTRALESLI